MVPPCALILRYIIQIYTNDRSRASTGVFIIRLHICMYKLQSLYTSRDYAARLIPSGVAESFLVIAALNLLINHHFVVVVVVVSAHRAFFDFLQYSIVQPDARYFTIDFLCTRCPHSTSLSCSRNHTWSNSSCNRDSMQELYFHENYNE